jgi:hypothetical protein
MRSISTVYGPKVVDHEQSGPCARCGRPVTVSVGGRVYGRTAYGTWLPHDCTGAVGR